MEEGQGATVLVTAAGDSHDVSRIESVQEEKGIRRMWKKGREASRDKDRGSCLCDHTMTCRASEPTDFPKN